jgi:spore germination protein YaaH
MPENVPPGVTPFVFSDPLGKRWPRLRTCLLITGVLFFFGAVLFVETLFIAPRMTAPFSLRQLKGQLKSLQKQNPAVQSSTPNSLLWQKFEATKQATKKLAKQTIVGSPSATPARPRRKAPDNEVRLAFYTNGDPYSYSSLEQHASQITHVCPEWMSMVNGVGDLQIDADARVSKLAQSKGIALMPLLTNLVGDTWQPEAVENVAHGPPERQEKFIANVLVVLRDAKAAGVVVDWEQLDPTYKKNFTELLKKFAGALHRDGRQLWLSVSPGQEIDYIDFEELSAHVDRFVALLFDETSDIDSPGPLASRMWFEGWLHVLLEDSDPKQWIIALGSYGYDWVIGGKKAELISFPEAMSRASNAEIDSAEVSAPGYNAYFYYEDNDKEHAVWFLDVVTFLNELREVRKQNTGGFALYRLGTEDTAIWDALAVTPDFKFDLPTRSLLEVLRGTDTITDVGDGEIVTVDESRADGMRTLSLDKDNYLTANYTKFPEFPTLYHQGAGDAHEVALTFDDGPDPEWTPKILDVLKAAKVKAAFFLVGVNAERYPNLVRRIVAEGHEIGNHTYYHPNLALCWPEHVRLELQTGQVGAHGVEKLRVRLAEMAEGEIDEGMPHPPHRVQHAHRALHDVAEMPPADRGQRLPLGAPHLDRAVGKLEGDGAGHHLERRLGGGGNGLDQGGLAAARFAGETVDLVGRNAEADIVDGTDLALDAERGRPVVGAQARHGEDGFAHPSVRPRRLRGSMYSFIDTASRKSPTKVMTTSSTGKKIHHQMPATRAVCWLAQ